MARLEVLTLCSLDACPEMHHTRTAAYCTICSAVWGAAAAMVPYLVSFSQGMPCQFYSASCAD